jgi:hypothetical protein
MNHDREFGAITLTPKHDFLKNKEETGNITKITYNTLMPALFSRSNHPLMHVRFTGSNCLLFSLDSAISVYVA